MVYCIYKKGSIKYNIREYIYRVHLNLLNRNLYIYVCYLNIMYFDKVLDIRITEEQVDMIKELNNKFPNKYQSLSHAIRCAIIKLHKEELEKWKKNKEQK